MRGVRLPVLARGRVVVVVELSRSSLRPEGPKFIPEEEAERSNGFSEVDMV
jgi:hypothetical protein